jgi:3-dehydroquinate synthase
MIHVDLGERSYDVHFQSLRELPELMAGAGLEPGSGGGSSGRCLLVTDENVGAHYRSPVAAALERAGWTVRAHVVPAGEATKSAEHLHEIYDVALDWGIDRQTPVVALGGGVVGDLAGFAAATLLRGVPLVQCPTSLLAQVDASVGGKTAINHETGKNLIGAFYQPRLVCADPDTLDTLPMREWASGTAEMVKHALIASPDLFEHLEENLVGVMARKDRGAIATAIERAVGIKRDVVVEDERETGRREILNFGHTFAHAIEKVAGYGTFTHGEAVAVGMRAGLYLSHRRNPDRIDRDRLDHVVSAIPVDGNPSALDREAVFDAMSADKKARGGTVRFVLLDRLGHARVTGDVTRGELEQAWAFACGE